MASARGPEGGTRSSSQRGRLNPNSEPPARPRPGPDAAAHRGDQAASDVQADPGAVRHARRARGPVVELEQAVGLLGVDPAPAVQDADEHLVGRRRRRRRSPRVPAGLYLPAFETRFRRTCSTYVRSPKTAGRSDGISTSNVILGQRRASEATRAPARCWMSSGSPSMRDPALDPGECEQVLDDPVQAIRLHLDVGEHLVAIRRAAPDAGGPWPSRRSSSPGSAARATGRRGRPRGRPRPRGPGSRRGARRSGTSGHPRPARRRGPPGRWRSRASGRRAGRPCVARRHRRLLVGRLRRAVRLVEAERLRLVEAESRLELVERLRQDGAARIARRRRWRARSGPSGSTTRIPSPIAWITARSSAALRRSSPAIRASWAWTSIRSLMSRAVRITVVPPSGSVTSWSRRPRPGSRVRSPAGHHAGERRRAAGLERRDLGQARPEGLGAVIGLEAQDARSEEVASSWPTRSTPPRLT